MAKRSPEAVAFPSGNPEVVHSLFETLLNEGDLEQLVALYEREAALIDRDGLVVKGAEAISDYLRGLLSIKPMMEMTPLSIVNAGEVAVLVSHWKINGAGSDGAVIADSGRTYDVVKRQRDGTWKLVIHNPWNGSPVLSS